MTLGWPGGPSNGVMYKGLWPLYQLAWVIDGNFRLFLFP
jgi:hypothetical protein